MPTHYDILGADAHSSLSELRTAYRGRVRMLHPDSSRSGRSNSQELASLNRAWQVLSDPERRRVYDLSLSAALPDRPNLVVVPPPPAPQSQRRRREAWVQGVRAQISRLSAQAGKSATQTLLLRNSRGSRNDYERVVAALVDAISSETEARVRAARAAGAAPLDLGVGATLIGIRAVADGLRRNAEPTCTVEDVMAAELLDRMWDVLGHELPVTLTSALGGNPDIARHLQRRPV